MSSVLNVQTGPACYGKGGPLTITDANLVLGRIIPETFPRVFGKCNSPEMRGSPCNIPPDSNEGLNLDAVVEKFRTMMEQHPAEFQKDMSMQEVAYGFIRVANEAMSRPIRTLTESRGYEVSKHILL